MRRREVTVLPEALKHWRATRHMTQRDLGRAAKAEGPNINCSEALIAAIEAGNRQPSLETARAIAGALALPLTAIAIVHTDRFVPDGRPPSDEALASMGQILAGAA